MTEACVHENYRTFDDPDEITHKTNFTCSICGEICQIYIDLENILICKGCLGRWIELLNKEHLDHLVQRVRKD